MRRHKVTTIAAGIVVFSAALFASAGPVAADPVDKATFETELRNAVTVVYGDSSHDAVEIAITSTGGSKNGTVYAVTNPNGSSLIRFNMGDEKWETRCVTKTVCYMKEGDSRFWRNVTGGSAAWSFVYNPENVANSGWTGATYDVTGNTYTMADPVEGTLSAVFSPGHAVINSTGPDGSAVTTLTNRAPVKVKAPPKRLIHNPITISGK